MIAKDINNTILTINVVYRPETEKFFPDSNVAPNDFLARTRIGMWDVFYKYENYLRVVPHGAGFSGTPENIKAGNIFVYDKNGKEPYRPGTINEVRDYYSTKMASKVLVRTNDGVTAIMVIYK